MEERGFCGDVRGAGGDSGGVEAAFGSGSASLCRRL
jgi:hypothetical protein